MKTLEKVSDFVGKYMAAIVIVVAAGALFFPGRYYNFAGRAVETVPKSLRLSCGSELT